MSANDPKRTFPSLLLSGYTNIIDPRCRARTCPNVRAGLEFAHGRLEILKGAAARPFRVSSAVRFEPCSRLGCRTVTSFCSRFLRSPLSYGAGGILFWPSLHWWWVSPSGLDGNTHAQHGQPASSQERKCAAATPTPAARRPTSNTSTCAAGPTGGSN